MPRKETATTSLDRQLEKLKTPQTNQFEVKRGRESFLYEYSEAAGVDCDTHYALAVDGLKSLCELDLRLEHYKATLFDYSTKDWSRANRTQDECQKMDSELERFVWEAIAPYFLLADCHKVFEWLIYKFRIHESLPDVLIVALCPYSETQLFPKLLQCMPKFKKKSHKWHFLYANQKTGTPVSRNGLIAHVKTRSWFMSEINRAAGCSDCQNVVVNCTSLWMGVLSDTGNGADGPDEVMISLAIDYCSRGFNSGSKDRIMSAIAVFSFIVSKYNLQPHVVTSFLKKSCSSMRKNDSLLEVCIRNYLLMLVVISQSQALDALPSPVAQLVIKFLPVISETANTESLSRLLASSFDPGSESFLDDLKSCCSQLKKIPKKLLEAIEIAAFKKWSSTSDLEERAAVVCLLLKLQVTTGQKRIEIILNQLLTEPDFFPEIVEMLTVNEHRQRPSFDPLADNWQAVMLLLEHFHHPYSFLYSTNVMTTCFTLLKESFLIDFGSDYFKKSLLDVITNCLKQEDIDQSSFDVSVILEALKFMRHDKGQKECLEMLTRIMASATVKDRLEMTKKLAVSFTFIGSNLVKCDDKRSLEIVNETIDSLAPLLVSKPTDGNFKEVSSILDVFIDTLPDVPSHRRLDIFRRILSLASDPQWSAMTVVKLVEANFGPRRPDHTGLNFAAQLLPHLPKDHHQVILDTMLDLVMNKSRSLIVHVHGIELMQSDEFKVKTARFMALIAPECSKLCVNVPLIVKSLVDSLKGSASGDGAAKDVQKKVENFLLVAIGKVIKSTFNCIIQC